MLSSLDEAKNIGAKYIVLPGYGEPFMNKETWLVLEHAKKLEMHVTIFTNGGLLVKEQIEKLREYPVTLIIKCNSFDTEKEDKISGVENYAVKRNETLKMAIDAGFNVPDENGNIRMGLAAMTYKDNVDDIVEVIEWATQNNIIPMVSGTVLTGNAEKNQDTMGNPEDLSVAFSEVEKRIKEKSPELYKQIFTPRGGNIIAGISSLFLEYPSGRITNDFMSSSTLGDIEHETLTSVWGKEKENRAKKTEEYKKRIENLGELDKYSPDFFDSRPNAVVLKSKRDQYINVSIEEVFRGKSKLSKITNKFKINRDINKKESLQNFLTEIINLVQDDIVKKHSPRKKAVNKSNRENILSEYPTEKIVELIKLKLKEYLGETDYHELIQKVEQSSGVSIHSNAEYAEIDPGNPLVNSEFWCKGDYKNKQIYLPTDKTTAVSFAMAAKAIGHFVKTDRNETNQDDFDSAYQEDVRAWIEGWKYLKKNAAEYFDRDSDAIDKIEPIVDLIRQELLKIMEMTKPYYGDTEMNEQQKREIFFKSKNGTELLTELERLKGIIDNELLKTDNHLLNAKIDWEKFCHVIENTLIEVERDNEIKNNQ